MKTFGMAGVKQSMPGWRHGSSHLPVQLLLLHERAEVPRSPPFQDPPACMRATLIRKHGNLHSMAQGLCQGFWCLSLRALQCTWLQTDLFASRCSGGKNLCTFGSHCRAVNTLPGHLAGCGWPTDASGSRTSRLTLTADHGKDITGVYAGLRSVSSIDLCSWSDLAP